jgi:hypothetical protein
MAYIEISDLVDVRPRRRPRRGRPDLGSSSGALMYAMAQTAQIKQALEAGDPITAISIAAGNPWTTKPSVAQVEAMINNPQQGAQILQKLYDSLQGPGYRSPLPQTMPFAQLQQSLQQYLAQLQPPASATPVKAVQQGTINLVNTPTIQSFVQSILPAGMPVPPPVTSAGPPTAAPAPAVTPTALAQAQVNLLTQLASAGQIQLYQAPPSGCPPYMVAQVLADGTQVCVDYVQARSNAILAAAQAALGAQNVAVASAGSACAPGANPLALPDGRQLCVNPAVGTIALIASSAACPSGYMSSPITIAPQNLLTGVSVSPMPPSNQTSQPPSSLTTDVLCYALAAAQPTTTMPQPTPDPNLYYNTYSPPPVPAPTTSYAPAYPTSYDSGYSMPDPTSQQPAPAPLPPPAAAASSVPPVVYVLGAVAVAGLGYLLWKKISETQPPAPPAPAAKA